VPITDIYFDHVSSTPVHPELATMFSQYTTLHYANSDALHDLGTKIAAMQEKSRDALAQLLTVSSEELFFTSGATEANNTLIKGIAFAYQHKGKHIITTKVEHSSVRASFLWLEQFGGFEISWLNVDSEGRVDLEDIRQSLRPDTSLVSIMAVNNEVGTIMPIDTIADIIHSNSKAVFHVDLVQAVAKVPFSLAKIDAASMSAHKIHGFKGSGLIYKRKNVACETLIHGGQQEGGLRGGTQNAIVNVLWAKTLRLALEDYHLNHQHVMEMNAYLRHELSQIDSVIINSPLKEVSAYILNFSCLTMSSEVLLNYFNQHHIYVSAQSTCSSKTKSYSTTLIAMKVSQERLEGSIRIGLSSMNTLRECEFFIQTLKEGLLKYANPR
jgi:cysteine desulfurase